MICTLGAVVLFCEEDYLFIVPHGMAIIFSNGSIIISIEVHSNVRLCGGSI